MTIQYWDSYKMTKAIEIMPKDYSEVAIICIPLNNLLKSRDDCEFTKIWLWDDYETSVRFILGDWQIMVALQLEFSWMNLAKSYPVSEWVIFWNIKDTKKAEYWINAFELKNPWNRKLFGLSN